MNKNFKKLTIGIIIFSMMAVYGSVSPASAVTSLTSVSDTLSTSANSALSNHTISFNMVSDLAASDKIDIIFQASSFDLTGATSTCPTNSTGSIVGQTLTCTATGAVASGTKTVLLNNTINPATTTSYTINFNVTQSSVVVERSQIRVAIIDQVVMTARVDATLSFSVAATSSGVTINGHTTNNASTATSTPFGTLNVGATSTVGQDLRVATNATNGYVVTVEQSDELRNSTGDTINSFRDSANGVGSTSPAVWAAPGNILDAKDTYGHMGLTTNDDDLYIDGAGGAADDGIIKDTNNQDFRSSKFVGLKGTSTTIVMAHTNDAAGPSDGTTQNKGYASVLFMAEISALQEAGDYTNTLTYICTPTY